MLLAGGALVAASKLLMTLSLAQIGLFSLNFQDMLIPTMHTLMFRFVHRDPRWTPKNNVESMLNSDLAYVWRLRAGLEPG